MSIKIKISIIAITTSTLLMISTPFVAAQQQSFGGVQFNGVGAAILACSGVADAILDAIADIRGSAQAAAGTQILGTAPGIVQPTDDKKGNLRIDRQIKKESCSDGIAYTLGNVMMQNFVNNTITWVNTGFNGTPYFIRNQESFFANITRNAEQTFLNELPGVNDVYGNAVRYAMIAQQTGRTASPSALRGNNDGAVQRVNDFTNDFKNGGWNQFFNMSQFSSQNPVGSLFQATETLQERRQRLIDEKVNEITRGNGFMDQKKCVEWGLGGSTGTTVRNPVTGQESRVEPVCLKEEVVTPGKIIAEQASKATQAAQERSAQADELNETLGRFLDRMISNLANRGLAALMTPRSRSQQVAQSGPNTSSASQNSFIDIQSSFDESEFTITNPKHLQGLIKAQKDYLSVIRDSRIAAEESLAELGYLDYCIPGPNPQMTQIANQNIRGILDGLNDGYVRSRFLSSRNFRRLQPAPFIVENPVFEGDFILNNAVYINDYVDDDEEKAIFIGNIQNKSAHYFELFNTLFSRNRITTFFESLQSTQQERDSVRGSIQSALLETSRLPEYSKNMNNLLSTYEQTDEIITENIQELESIHRTILGIVTNARARHIAEQRALGVTVNLECLDIQYSTNDPIIVGRVRRKEDAISPRVQLFRDAQSAFFAPRNLYRGHSLPRNLESEL